MTNAVYDKARQAALNGGINWTSGNIKAVLVDTTKYTVNLSTHNWLSDITGAARVATSSNFTTKTSTAGVANADNITFSSVSGAVSAALVIYLDTGTESTSLLIAYIDTATGLPVTPNGGNINVTWDTGANKIFKL